MQLTDEQLVAISSIHTWLAEANQPFFMLKGSAGTGKTFCIRELAGSITGTFAFTAPTNKATKVLKDSVSTADYKPLCKTIYSLLALTLGYDGEVKRLQHPKESVNLSVFRAIVVDEASMISKELFAEIEKASAKYDVKFIFMGDAAQLPPVNEKSSRVWEIGNGAELTKVMRHDNTILDLAVKLRTQVDAVEPSIELAAANDGIVGVWRYDNKDIFEDMIISHAKAGKFSVPNTSKVIAWRNKRVDIFNRNIRNIIFPGAVAWVPGDRILLASVIKDHNDFVVACVDDEGKITNTDIEIIGGFKTWLLEIELDNERVVVASVIHEDSIVEYEARLRIFANEAKARERSWKDYWNLKEMFHEIKYAYAITAHRAQGSTYETAFVCWQDILRNSNVNEAYRCLYVACTRPSKQLILS